MTVAPPRPVGYQAEVQEKRRWALAGAQAAGPFAPNAFVRISPDDVVTVLVNKSEMGQGVHTALAMLVAEELECDWSRIRIEPAPVEPRYYDPVMREYRTDGSTSIMSSWEPFRQAGAIARHLLIEAAAKAWSADAQTLRTEGGRVHGPAGLIALARDGAPLERHNTPFMATARRG